MTAPTHWMARTKLTITNAQREKSTSDYQEEYNVPCRRHGGRIKPIHPCKTCGGGGKDLGGSDLTCYVCHGSGGKAAT